MRPEIIPMIGPMHAITKRGEFGRGIEPMLAYVAGKLVKPRVNNLPV